MNTLKTRLLYACLALALSACAIFDNYRQVQPGVSTTTSVIARYGQPTRIWQDADGGQTLEYSSQPFGESCYMIKTAADGKVLRIENSLSAAVRSRVTPGMTVDQVSRLLGRERSRMFFERLNEDVWDWTVSPGGFSYARRFNVHFRNGAVFRTSESMLDPEDVHMGL